MQILELVENTRFFCLPKCRCGCHLRNLLCYNLTLVTGGNWGAIKTLQITPIKTAGQSIQKQWEAEIHRPTNTNKHSESSSLSTRRIPRNKLVYV